MKQVSVKALFVAWVALSVFVVSGCGGNNGNSSSPAPSATPSAQGTQGGETASPASELKGKIDIGVLYAPVMDQLTQEVNAYMEIHPGVEITLNPFGGQDYHAAMKTQLIGGSAPVGITALPETAQNFFDHMDPLDEYMEMQSPYTQNKWKDDFDPKAYEITKAGTDHVWLSAVTGAVNSGVWYNADLLQQLNLSVPANWDEFMNAQAKAKEAGYIPMAVQYTSITPSDWSLWTFSYMFLKDEYMKLDTIVQDGRVSQEEMARGISKKLIDMGSPKVKEMFTAWKKWSDLAWPENFSSDWGNVQSFVSGKSLFYWGINAEAPNLNKLIAGQFKLDHFPMPNMNDASDPIDLANVAVGMGINKAATPEQKQILVDFMQYLTQPDVHKRIVESIGMLPVVKGVTLSDPSNESWAQALRFNGSALQPASLDSSFSNQFFSESQGYLLGKTDLDTFVSKYAKLYEESVERLVKSQGWDTSKW